ncbi:hypothetical protein NPIL_96451 [Nephila pilipes]|uniref:Uncharacterized protein n=1 Tax=Nephila pilipes TaxID=299642 RepID=A0A8X6TK90_NEPPI|nr:hypothetical protein NPIL_96451 [Nephila pilipes]
MKDQQPLTLVNMSESKNVSILSPSLIDRIYLRGLSTNKLRGLVEAQKEPNTRMAANGRSGKTILLPKPAQLKLIFLSTMNTLQKDNEHFRLLKSIKISLSIINISKDCQILSPLNLHYDDIEMIWRNTKPEKVHLIKN